jgi:hypothetical protein
MFFGDIILDLADDVICYLLENIIKLVDLSSFIERHHRDLIFCQTFDDVLVALEYFERVSENVIVIAACALRIIFSN